MAFLCLTASPVPPMESQPLMHRAPAPLLDIAYYDGVDAHLHKHKLDVFHPPNFKASAALRPVVLHVHGTNTYAQSALTVPEEEAGCAATANMSSMEGRSWAAHSVSAAT